jgi:acetoin utilization deacetylase AcuC-like enzyme
MSTLLAYAPAEDHTKQHHPESAERMIPLLPILEQTGLISDLIPVKPVAATMEQLRRVHTVGLVNYVQAVSLRGGGLLDHGDTYVTAESYDLARLASGACCASVDAILTGAAHNGFALIRPPGHHAETDRVSGFCLFNNVAAAARQAQVVHGLRRVAIIDFDVHHGNGTQDIFYEDDSVLFVSTHLFAPYFYPGIGSMNEQGAGRGKGYTMNVPFPPGVGDVGYRRAFDEIILPRLAEFRPEMLLVSAGYDAHWQDPLAMAGLSLTGYAILARWLVTAAENLCGGRILFVLEGGYDHTVLAAGVANTFYALLGRDQILDPLGPLPQAEHDISELLDRMRRHYLPNESRKRIIDEGS